MKNATLAVLLSLLLAGCGDGRVKPYKPSSGAQEVLNNYGNFSYNMDYEKRDSLLGIKADWRNTEAGLVAFEGIDVRTLDALIAARFAHPLDQQNDAPTLKEIFLFMAKYPQVLASGYAVSPLRDDYRITIDSLYVPRPKVTSELRQAFIELAKDADESGFSEDLYCWWD
jgi:hypothetical protein